MTIKGLLKVFICVACGDILEDEVVFQESTEAQPVGNVLCATCKTEVSERIEDGQECFAEVSDERYIAAIGGGLQPDEKE
jgi:DNA-directed RNA polymerase subunit RPC12/RpoP